MGGKMTDAIDRKRRLLERHSEKDLPTSEIAETLLEIAESSN